MDYLKKGGRVLLCAWHQQFFAAIRHFQNYRDFKPALMISQSSDGGIIAGVAEKNRFGVRCGGRPHAEGN